MKKDQQRSILYLPSEPQKGQDSKKPKKDYHCINKDNKDQWTQVSNQN